MYGELIVGVNMLFNYAILSFANKVGNVQATRKRLLLASFAGAVPVTLLPSSIFVIVISFVIMTGIAFGSSFEPWKKSASTVLIGAVFAGGLLTVFQYRTSLSTTPLTVITYAVVAYVSLYFMKKKWSDVRTTRQVASLKSTSVLRIWGHDIPVKVFVDPGNSCTEPLSGAPVHFVSFHTVEKAIPENLKTPLLEWDTHGSPELSGFPDVYHKDMRLVRLLTVQGQSWAIGFKFEQWTIQEERRLEPGYIVFTKKDRRYPDGVGAILHITAMESLIEEGGTVHVA
ncbi:sigma-E processing peptidase SpoIIGA [Filibacter tadaridae]|uniref:Sporulation factor SpoIIGA n=1 Tax=Filibacter tadaridae TaxID=2483811 RepID=A0A3P5X4L4_9BACL|nr:sigma-E processing peptidase SpoIIGA [Filibacter tadaridae]VDC29834.1 Sporulation factor SpoIIGA [Filibacter tadaridae]